MRQRARFVYRSSAERTPEKHAGRWTARTGSARSNWKVSNYAELGTPPDGAHHHRVAARSDRRFFRAAGGQRFSPAKGLRNAAGHQLRRSTRHVVIRTAQRGTASITPLDVDVCY